MSEITTVEQLDALPAGAEIRDRDDWSWTKGRTGGWTPSPQPGSNAKRVLELWSPLRLAEPDELSPLHVTKCCAHDCPNTAPLQPGSSYLCPDHGDGGCSNTITKGDS